MPASKRWRYVRRGMRVASGSPSDRPNSTIPVMPSHQEVVSQAYACLIRFLSIAPPPSCMPLSWCHLFRVPQGFCVTPGARVVYCIPNCGREQRPIRATVASRAHGSCTHRPICMTRVVVWRYILHDVYTIVCYGVRCKLLYRICGPARG